MSTQTTKSQEEAEMFKLAIGNFLENGKITSYTVRRALDLKKESEDVAKERGLSGEERYKFREFFIRTYSPTSSKPVLS